MKKFVLVFLSLILVVSLFGCGEQITKITDFERFSAMSKETQKIEVEFDNNTGVPFYFTITDQTDISVVMDIIFTTEVKKIKGQPMAGDNTWFTVFQGENEYRMSFRVNKEGKNYYNFATDDLQSKIRELATSAGAYARLK